MKQILRTITRYFLIASVIFALTTAAALLIAFFMLDYLSPIYVSTMGFGAGLFIVIFGAFSMGPMLASKLGGGMTRGGISQSAMGDAKTHQLLTSAKDSDALQAGKFIIIGIFVIIFAVITMLVTGM